MTEDYIPTWLTIIVPLAIIICGTAFTVIIHKIMIKLLMCKFDINAHWTEKARRFFPANQISQSIFLFVSILLAYLSTVLFYNKLWFFSKFAFFLTFYLCLFLSTGFIHYRYVKNHLPFHKTFFSFLDSYLFYTVFFVLMIPVIVFLSLVTPHNFHYMLYSYILGLIFYFFMLFCGSFHLAKSLGLLKTAPDNIQKILQETAKQSKIKLKHVWVIKWNCVNAIAFPINKSIGFTQASIDNLTEDEIYHLSLHELSHLKEKTWHSLFRPFPWIVLYLFCAIMGISTTSPDLNSMLMPMNGLVMLAILIFTLLFSFRIYHSFSVKREKEADEFAAKHSKDPIKFAKMLERIYQLNLIPAVLQKKTHTHPELYDRLTSCGLNPEYPRPKPVKKVSGLAFILIFGIFLLFYIFYFETNKTFSYYAYKNKNITAFQTYMLLEKEKYSNGPWVLADLGYLFYREKNYDLAIKIFEKSYNLEPNAYFLMKTAAAYIGLKNCNEAKRIIDDFVNKNTCESVNYDNIVLEHQKKLNQTCSNYKTPESVYPFLEHGTYFETAN